MHLQRYQEWVEKFDTLQLRSRNFFRTTAAQKLTVANSPHRSLGVHALLNNYYKLTPAQNELIVNAVDREIQLSDITFRPTISHELYASHFVALGEERLEHPDHDMYVALDNLLFKHGLLPLGCNELVVGHPKLLCERSPTNPENVHMVTAIDMPRFSSATGKAAVLELKTSNRADVSYTLFEMFCKERTAKQIQLTAYLLRSMSAELHLPVHEAELELYLAGVDVYGKRCALWKIDYDPVLFLGDGMENWHAHLPRMRESLRCCMCNKPAKSQSASDPTKYFCGNQCREKLD